MRISLLPPVISPLVFWLAILANTGHCQFPNLHSPYGFDLEISRPDVDASGTVTLLGGHNNGCVPYEISHTVSENRLDLEVLYPGAGYACTQVLTSWSLVEEFGSGVGPEFEVYVDMIAVNPDGSTFENPYAPLFDSPALTVSFGDTNFDGIVDNGDLGALLNSFERDGDFGWGAGDFTNDGSVTSADLGRLLNNFRQASGASGASVVPEPNTMTWLIVVLLFAAANSRYRV